MDTYDIQAIRGDTYKGVQFTVYANAAPMNLSAAAIRMYIRKASKQGTITKKLAVGTGINITNGAGGQFQIDAFLVDFDAGMYYYDIEFTISSVISTYIEGKFEVLQDVTND
jgi:hypothetical protein